MAIGRIPFEEAISEPRLLKKAFDELSGPQQVVLKAFYGLPLKGEELDYWAMLQGFAEYDELGYPTRITPIPYTPKEYEELVGVLGRRSGKTDRIVGLAAAYEATLGGHLQYVRKGQIPLILFIAQDLDSAKRNMTFIAQNIETSPILMKEIIQPIQAEKIALKSGMTIVPETPSIKGARGFAIPVVVMDELGFWYKDAKSANPDFEVERAVDHAQAQFPHPKKFKITTPWTMEGIAYQGYVAGTEGSKIRCDSCKPIEVPFCPHKKEEQEEFADVLVVHAPTAAMKNPLITKKRLIKLRNKDKEAFKRESLAQFIRTIDGFLNERMVELAIERGVFERARDTKRGFAYVAAIDPAFRHDSFAFTIGHADPEKGIVQDYLKEWVPEKDNPLKPGEILDEIKEKLDQFGISAVYSDQYQLESLQQLASDRQFVIIGVDFTGKSKAKICGSLRTLLNQGRLKLLDNETQKTQLLKLQKTITSQGTIQIAAPPPHHDDIAMVTSLMAHQTVWLLPMEEESTPSVEPEPTPHERCLAQIEKGYQEDALGDNVWDWIHLVT